MKLAGRVALAGMGRNVGATAAWTPTDNEAYCWLKVHLPDGYRAVANPRADYFTEQSFCYRVYRDDTLLKEWHGDFRNVREGALAMDIVSFVRNLSGQGC